MSSEPDTALGDNRGETFMQLVDRILELEATRAKAAAEIKAAYAEAESEEFDVKAMKHAIKLATKEFDISATMGKRVTVGAYLATIAERSEDDEIKALAAAVLESEVR